MKPFTSIITTTHNRDDSLIKHLESIQKQKTEFNFEVLVLDDYYESKDSTKKIVSSFGYAYTHTGKTKQGKNIWRVPGFALNIGAKLSSSDILTITGSDIIIQGENSYQEIIDIYTEKKCLVTVNSVMYGNRRESTRMPWFMTIPKETFMYIRGYDEDFTGVAAEDNDLMDRLMSLKELVQAPVDLIHQSHERVDSSARKHHNVELWIARKGKIVRNQNRDWGVL